MMNRSELTANEAFQASAEERTRWIAVLSGKPAMSFESFRAEANRHGVSVAADTARKYGVSVTVCMQYLRRFVAGN